MAGGCENVTARCEATCSLSWSIPTLRRTTMAARGNCGPQPHTERAPGASGRRGAPICSLAFDPSWAPPDNKGSERELRPTATYRKVTGGFRSKWGADLFAVVRSVVGTAARQGKNAYPPICAVLDGKS